MKRILPVGGPPPSVAKRPRGEKNNEPRLLQQSLPMPAFSARLEEAGLPPHRLLAPLPHKVSAPARPPEGSEVGKTILPADYAGALDAQGVPTAYGRMRSGQIHSGRGEIRTYAYPNHIRKEQDGLSGARFPDNREGRVTITPSDSGEASSRTPVPGQYFDSGKNFYRLPGQPIIKEDSLGRPTLVGKPFDDDTESDGEDGLKKFHGKPYRYRDDGSTVTFAEGHSVSRFPDREDPARTDPRLMKHDFASGNRIFYLDQDGISREKGSVHEVLLDKSRLIIQEDGRSFLQTPNKATWEEKEGKLFLLSHYRSKPVFPVPREKSPGSGNESSPD